MDYDDANMTICSRYLRHDPVRLCPSSARCFSSFPELHEAQQ